MEKKKLMLRRERKERLSQEKNEEGTKTRWLGLEFFANDTHAEATPWILKGRFKWRRKVAKEFVNGSERKGQQLHSSGLWDGEMHRALRYNLTVAARDTEKFTAHFRIAFHTQEIYRAADDTEKFTAHFRTAAHI